MKHLPFFIFAVLFVCLVSIAPALATQPTEWNLNLQTPATPVAEKMFAFHTLLLWIIGGITGLVLFLLLFVCFRFNARANPVPATFTHNTKIEIVWTLVPVMLLAVIAWFSFPLMYYGDRAPHAPEMTLKVTGYQWYWGYEYLEPPEESTLPKDMTGINFMANMVPDSEIDTEKGQLRLLSTDNVVVLPVDTVVQIQVTAADVIHSFAVPAFGIKTDAVPGRLNEVWVKIQRPGKYYGQCSEICGINHAFMPIEIHAVSKEEFAAWVAQAKVKFGAYDTGIKLASVRQ